MTKRTPRRCELLALLPLLVSCRNPTDPTRITPPSMPDAGLSPQMIGQPLTQAERYSANGTATGGSSGQRGLLAYNGGTHSTGGMPGSGWRPVAGL